MELATVTLEVNAPARHVWNLLGERFGDIGAWCATVNTSRAHRDTTPIDDAPVAGRYCETVFGPFTETFRGYDDRAMSMRYDANSERLPFFVRKFTNAYTVTPLGDDRCEVRMVARADMMQPFALLMGWMMRMQVGKALVHQVEELRHYAERGEPHPRKVAAMQRWAEKRALAAG